MKQQPPRLKIESFLPEKIKYLEKWVRQKKVHKNLYMLYRPMSGPELTAWHKKEVADGSHLFFYSTGENELSPAGIGLVHYIHPKNRCGELSIIINPEYFGKGYGTQVLQHLMHIAFNDLNLHKIFAHAVEFNLRSISLLEKMRFVREAVYRNELYWSDQYYDIFRYGLLEEEYLKM